ncbi:MAG: phosphoribosylaminoimidazolesuccinocarboxamide synthase [Thaumarchaeota archaeon]|nr:phosphoribosylaminoimidazolesuccinocarboxamide synthase [Nitrososphaerota archaeon]
MTPPGKFLRSGKVKDIYELDDRHLLFHFTDRVSAYDVILPSKIPRKGEVLCRLGAYLFETLGVPHHMVRLEGEDMMVVKKMDMIMVECVVRGYLYGSLMERFAKGEVTLPVEKVMAARLPQPYFDPTTKSDVKDEPVTESDILTQGRATPEELKAIKDTSLVVYKLLGDRAARQGFVLADIKLEFGRNGGDILLGDSIGPDEFRMWPESSYAPGKTQESFDKQPIRDWLSSQGYKAKLDQALKSGGAVPSPPELPEWLVEETSRRYATVYQSLSGKTL